MKIIVGLGNPENKYEYTRHNAGFLAIDALASDLGAGWTANKKFKALIAEQAGFLLVKPQTYMNLSGESVQAILSFYKIDPHDPRLPDMLTVIHDEMDIDLGQVRVSVDSRSAGHNGVQSIIDKLGTKNFTRIRIGIKIERPEGMPTDKFVLQKFGKNELEAIYKVIPEIIKGIKK